MPFKEIGNDISKIFIESAKFSKKPIGFKARTRTFIDSLNPQSPLVEQEPVVETGQPEIYIPTNHSTVIANKKVGDVFELNLSSVSKNVGVGTTVTVIDESRQTPNLKVEILAKDFKPNSRNTRVVLKAKVLE